MKIVIEPHADGVSFRVKVHAGAKRDRVGGAHDGALKVEVATAPARGKANRAVLRLLATSMGVPPGAVTLLSGGTSPRKRVAIRGLSVEEAERRLIIPPSTVRGGARTHEG